MKKILLTLAILHFTLYIHSQNIQLHRDFGEDRNYFTSTVEMFKPDKWGSTFFFVDMNYSTQNIKGVSLAYWEIARCLKFWEAPISINLEYNGGFGQWHNGTTGGAYQINSAWLGGLNYSWNNSDFTKGISAKVLYKYIQDKHDASFQLTMVWYAHFFDKKLTFNGFIDFWKEKNIFENKKPNGDLEVIETEFVFLSEPQIWYNFTKNFSIGGEVELSYNFGGMEGFNAMPTLGAKWTF